VSHGASHGGYSPSFMTLPLNAAKNAGFHRRFSKPRLPEILLLTVSQSYLGKFQGSRENIETWSGHFLGEYESNLFTKERAHDGVVMVGSDHS